MNVLNPETLKPSSSPAPTRFVVVMLVSLHAGGAGALAEFRRQAAPLFARYDVRIERALSVSAKGQIVGENTFEQPDLVQVVSFPSAAQFQAYTTDARYVELARQRDLGIRRMTVIAGVPLDVADIATPSRGAETTRLYGVGLVRFKPGGGAGMDAFNRQAQALFARHGMHIESMVEAKQTVTPIGVAEGMSPERVVVFFLDDGAAMRAYALDPEYKALAPLRDDGLASYDLFLGTVPPAVP